jgi:hypothetical protein
MHRRPLSFLLVALACSSALAASPYAGQDLRDIKALAPHEVADYVAGKGMGFAKAAELNGYPGPAHVLELAAELQLSDEQQARTRGVFERMQARAVALGRQLVDEERRLDELFARRAITVEALRASLQRIGALQAEIRATHLQAHLEQTALLSPHQVSRYAALRGYGQAPEAHQRQKHTGH